MAKTATNRGNGHTRQRPASARAKATSQAKPRRRSNGSHAKAQAKSSANARASKSPNARAAKSPNGRTANSPKGSTAKARKSPAKSGKTASAKSRAANGAQRAKQGAAKTKARSRSQTTRAAKRPVKKAAAAVKDTAEALPTPKPSKPVRKLTGFALKRAAKKTFGSWIDLVRDATDGAGAKALEAIRDAADRASAVTPDEMPTPKRRLPIQRSVDIAVPIRVAWEEWMAFDALPEGIHTITDIERDGDELFGRVSGPRDEDWEAEIIDEREQESFAWQSHEGTDCAGLATFHSLSERLTRIELNLDVVPTTPAEAFQLTTHIADRRAENDLRRLKARLELINPDLYEEEDASASEDGDEAEEGASQTEDHADGQPEEEERAEEGNPARSARADDDFEDEDEVEDAPEDDGDLDDEPEDEYDEDEEEPEPREEYEEVA